MYRPYIHAYYILYVYGQSEILNTIYHVFPCVTIKIYLIYIHAYYILYILVYSINNYICLVLLDLFFRQSVGKALIFNLVHLGIPYKNMLIICYMTYPYICLHSYLLYIIYVWTLHVCLLYTICIWTIISIECYAMCFHV